MVTISNEEVAKIKLASALRSAGLKVEERKIDLAFKSGFKIVTFKDAASPYSVDVILESEELNKRKGKIAGLDTFFQSPEGLIAAKLRMIKATLSPERSAKDKTDVKAILAFTSVDLEAVKQQAKKDNTLDIFETLSLDMA